jgi:DNA replication protein DnaC
MSERRHLVREDLERMNLPEEFWLAKVQGVPESVLEPVVQYLSTIETFVQDGIGMLILGDTGVGKSGIAALACKEARCRGLTVFFASVWELREAIRSRMAFDEDQTVWERAQDVNLLVLDSLQKSDMSEMFLGGRSIADLLAHRAQRHRATVITTRMDAQTLAESFPELVAAGTGHWVILSVVGPNMRERQAEKISMMVG